MEIENRIIKKSETSTHGKKHEGFRGLRKFVACIKAVIS